MSELKDPAIKLFGKTISLPQNEAVSDSIDVDHHHSDRKSSSTTAAASQDNKNSSEELTGSKQEDDDSTDPAAEESVEPPTDSGTSDSHKASGAENDTLSPKDTKEDLDENSLSQEKTLKKPDKILTCPRCNSLDTKFCYFNNYNVNQPRHFCKNCQRYWTAGGTMRNVPVGSGRRKNKNTSTSNYHHIMISDALQAVRADAVNGIHLPTLKANGTVLTFGAEKPLCESVATVLNLAERQHNHLLNGFHGPEQRTPIPSGGKVIAKDHSNCSSSANSNSAEKGGSHESVLKDCQCYNPQVPPFAGPPWPFPWNSAQWRTLPPPAISSSGFPVSFYPAPPYFACAAPIPWTMPWLSPTHSSPDHSSLSASPTSPTLGKHSREGNALNRSDLMKEEPSEGKTEERCILIPKTLRIDDPNEAAKSSIWSTLGIKNEKINSIGGTSLFKAFPSKGDGKNRIADTSLVLLANPAAFSRSQSFRETT